MSGLDFDYFRDLVHARSGLVLGAEKAYLVQSRLAPIARAEGLGGVPELLASLRKGAARSVVQKCVDAMATHESFFFRDSAPFEQIAQTVLPELIARKRNERTLRIWCAACSSGQEPYSVAIVLQEAAAQLAGWKVEILATDMSEPILQKARAGLYSDFEVRRGLSPERLNRWFTPAGQAWQVSRTLQQMVGFRAHNLLQDPLVLGRFDVILCRNVLIYFDVDRKRAILGDLRRVLDDDGYLLLGSSESLFGITESFEGAPGARGLYVPAKGTKMARSA